MRASLRTCSFTHSHSPSLSHGGNHIFCLAVYYVFVSICLFSFFFTPRQFVLVCFWTAMTIDKEIHSWPSLTERWQTQTPILVRTWNYVMHFKCYLLFFIIISDTKRNFFRHKFSLISENLNDKLLITQRGRFSNDRKQIFSQFFN